MTPDEDQEATSYQAGIEYPKEFTGHFVTPVFEVRPVVPDQYIYEDITYKEAMARWVDAEQPLMGPEQFKEYVFEQGKSVFSGEQTLRTQAVIQGTAVHDEWRKSRDKVQLGFTYLVAFYYNSSFIKDGDNEFKRPECLMENDLERWVDQAEDMFNNTPYEVTRHTIIPYKAGEEPLDSEYEKY